MGSVFLLLLLPFAFCLLPFDFSLYLMMHRTFEIRVPASTANLGPAFDTMGLALGLYLTVRVTVGKAGSAWTLSASGTASQGISLRPEDNLICKTAQTTAAALGVDLPALEVEIINDIPLGSGLGSSAAAIAAGVSIVEGVTGWEFSTEEFLRHAMVFENHGDNLAPARLGGWVICCEQENAPLLTLRRTWPSEISAVVVRPHFALSTQTMRTVLPASISRADAVFQMQRIAMFVTAMEERRFDLLREAMRDRLHQPYRAPHVPGLVEMLKMSHPGLLAIALSGAGPSVLALVTDHQEAIAARMQECFTRHGCQSTAYLLQVDHQGRTLEVDDPRR